MDNQDRYLAGAFLAYSAQDKPIEHKARVFLIIEARSKLEALEAAAGLIKTPNAMVELAFTLSPWPSETVVIDHEYLDRTCKVKSMTVEE